MKVDLIDCDDTRKNEDRRSCEEAFWMRYQQTTQYKKPSSLCYRARLTNIEKLQYHLRQRSNVNQDIDTTISSISNTEQRIQRWFMHITQEKKRKNISSFFSRRFVSKDQSKLCTHDKNRERAELCVRIN